MGDAVQSNASLASMLRRPALALTPSPCRRSMQARLLNVRLKRSDMAANPITRTSGDEVGPLIYAYHPSRGLAYVGAGLLVFAVAFLTVAYLEIGPFKLVLPIILAIILVPVGVGF